MRAFLMFVGLLAGALLLAAALTYPAWLLVELVSDQPVHRVMHRLAMLFALLGLIWLVRRHRLNYGSAMGYGLPRREFCRQLALGFTVGLLLLSPLIVLLFELDLRVPKADAFTRGQLLAVLGSGLVSGFTIAFIEESFFRGALQTAVERESGPIAGVVLPSALYSCLHFLGGRVRLPDHEVDWTTGFAVLVKLFEKYGQPAALIDSLLALFAVGLLLSLIRRRTGAIAACIGLHASWVTLIAVTRGSSTDNEAAVQDWLTGSYDGVIGWGALAWTLAILSLALIFWRKGAASRS